MEMRYDGTLALPSSYAVMDEEEMMYLEGGYWFDMSRSSVAKLSDIALVVATAGVSIGISIRRFAIMKSMNVVTATIRQSVTRIGLAASVANTVVSSIAKVLDFSIGDGIAYLLDYCDASGLNNRVQF